MKKWLKGYIADLQDIQKYGKELFSSRNPRGEQLWTLMDAIGKPKRSTSGSFYSGVKTTVSLAIGCLLGDEAYSVGFKQVFGQKDKACYYAEHGSGLMYLVLGIKPKKMLSEVVVTSEACNGKAVNS